MARTEGMPHEEHLAYFLLARVRRHGDRAHLASRIASALRKVAPPTWRPWLGWELRLSGDALPEASAPALAEAVIAALIDGNLAAVDARSRELLASVARSADRTSRRPR